MQHKLAQELTHYEYLREQLVEQFPEADEETLLDTLEGMTDLHDMISAVTRKRLDDVTLVAALKSRITDMQARLSRIEVRAERLKAVTVAVMERAGIRKITQPDITLSLRPVSPRLEVVNEELIPVDFWLSQAPRLDRKGLLGVLKDGCAVPGAVLGNGGMTISVRTK